MAYKTNLGGSDATFQTMMEHGFGIVTVMNAKIFDAIPAAELKELTAYDIVNSYKTREAICELDTLKIANVTQEGPTKTVTGGQFSNPLIKFGKSARLEMQDALGNSKAIEALCGGIQEWNTNEALVGLHFGEDFVGPKMIIGDSFFIDRKSGQQVKVIIAFYQFLPDSIFNLTQDAEGDATVFDMNGDLLTSVIKVASSDPADTDHTHGVFYSIVDPKEVSTTKPIGYRVFAIQADVDAAGGELNAGDKIVLGSTIKTIAKIEETYDDAKKAVKYTVTYVTSA